VLTVELPLSQTNAKQARETVYRDLTADPYAGLEVEVTLEARDGAGNIAHSTPVRFTLPARIFTNPLARALIEQRQNLSLSPSGRNTAMRALDALTLAPDKFFDEKSMPVYVGMRAAYWGLKNARHQSDIAHVQDLLWQMAMALERGGLSSAAEELRQLQQMISQALAQGAPQAVIDALLQRYQQALNKYLQMLAQNPPPSDQKIPPGSKVMKPQDLQALLKAIQQLSQMGDREHAQQLLAMLQSLLENLHMTAGPGGSAQDQQTNKTLQGLSDLMGKQRQLMDKTFREQQGNPDPKSGGPKGLSQQQGQLRDQLNKLMQGEGKQGGPGGKELGEAQKQMGQAQGQLGNRSLDDAQQSEKQALDSMRQGAGQIAKQMMGQNGKEGESGGNEDPLGREGNGPSLGKGVKIPDKSAVERARNILKELRKRAEERGRPKEELDYIDRLLKQF
jgi:tetratricopeptide (TPR) repeat protein